MEASLQTKDDLVFHSVIFHVHLLNAAAPGGMILRGLNLLMR